MISELANHLWQSTLFAVAVWLLTLMCRKNRQRPLLALVQCASVKFFIPFTVLMALGDRLEWASSAPQIATPAVSATLAQVSRPFVEDRDSAFFFRRRLAASTGLLLPSLPYGYPESSR